MRKKFFCIFLLFFFVFSQYTRASSAKSEHTPMTCEKKLNLLEPAKPKTIYDYELLPDRNINTFKEKVSPISLGQKNGSIVPFATVYKNLNWQRPAYDLSNYLALPAGTGGPSPIHEYAFTIKYPYVVRLIVFNCNITSIKYYKNQILVSGEPLRKGLTIVNFDTIKFHNSKKLLQLAIPDGYELDYLVLYLSDH